MQEPEVKERKPNSGLGNLALLIGAVLLLSVVFLFCPGMLIAAFLRSWFTSWDVAQMWTFGIAISVAIWVGMYSISRDWRKTGIRYVVLCFFVSAIFVISHFGFRTHFTNDAIAYYFPKLADPYEDTATQDAQQTAPTARVNISTPAPINFSSPSPQPAITYRIAGLRAGDHLNVRQGPGSNYPTVTKLAAGEQGITLVAERVTNGTTVWQRVSGNGFQGWVNAEFLSPEVTSR